MNLSPGNITKYDILYQVSWGCFQKGNVMITIKFPDSVIVPIPRSVVTLMITVLFHV